MAAKTLPHHLDAEQRILGILFLDPKKMASVTDLLKTSDFFDANHQHIYEAMKQLDDQSKTIDYVSVGAILREQRVLESSGGLDYLYSLAEMIPSTSHLDTYVEMIKEASLKRDIIDYNELKELKPNDILNLQDKIKDKLDEIEDDIPEPFKWN